MTWHLPETKDCSHLSINTKLTAIDFLQERQNIVRVIVESGRARVVLMLMADIIEEKQRKIVELCKETDVSQIAFNQGAWVIGSQIAGNFNFFRQILKGRNAQSIIEKRIKEREEYLSEMRRLLRNWPD